MKYSAFLAAASAITLTAAAPVDKYTLQQYLPAAKHKHFHHHELRLQARDSEHPTIPAHTMPTHHDHSIQGRGREEKPAEPKLPWFVDSPNGNPVILPGDRPIIHPLNDKNKTCKCSTSKSHKKLEPGQKATVMNAALLAARTVDGQPMLECEKKVHKTRKMLKDFMHFFRLIVPWHSSKPADEYHGNDCNIAETSL